MSKHIYNVLELEDQSVSVICSSVAPLLLAESCLVLSCLVRLSCDVEKARRRQDASSSPVVLFYRCAMQTFERINSKEWKYNPISILNQLKFNPTFHLSAQTLSPL